MWKKFYIKYFNFLELKQAFQKVLHFQFLKKIIRGVCTDHSLCFNLYPFLLYKSFNTVFKKSDKLFRYIEIPSVGIYQKNNGFESLQYLFFLENLYLEISGPVSLGSAGGVMDDDSEFLIGEPSWNSIWVCYIQLCANTLGNAMDTSFFYHRLQVNQ